MKYLEKSIMISFNFFILLNFSYFIPNFVFVFSTCHDIAEILLKLTLSTNQSINQSCFESQINPPNENRVVKIDSHIHTKVLFT
jgi:hypothetical protein